MTIRNAAKALIIHENKILLNKNVGKSGEVYYGMPGGGQNQYETIEEAVTRECLEETGYRVNIDNLVGLFEEIITDESYRTKYPDYAHKMYFIFRCKLASESNE